MNTFIVFQIVLIYCMINVIYGQRPCCEDYCYSQDDERLQARYFGTKTAYEIAKERDTRSNYQVPNCRPTKLWLLSRYGTRLPGAMKIGELRELAYLRDEIVKNYEQRGSRPDRGGLCPQDFQLIKSWNWNSNISAEYSEMLSTQGWNDMKYLAKHFQNALPELDTRRYSSEIFLFRYANAKATEASFRAFADGLFGDNNSQQVHSQPGKTINDTFFQPYDNCDAWKRQSESIKQSNSEYSRFAETPNFQGLINDVSTRLGFKFPLELSKIERMWDMCRYEQAWSLDRPSNWCVAFTQRQVFTLEYHEDLKSSYENGYGSMAAGVNQNLACSAMSDMLKHIDSDSQPNVIASFGHAQLIQLFLTSMGVNRDSQSLRADNFDQHAQRKWRTSAISSYGANVAVAKYHCTGEAEQSKVIFFLNQRPIDLEWCRVGLCDWPAVKSKYMKFMNGGECSKIFCGDVNSANAFLSNPIIIAINVLFTVFTINYLLKQI